MKHKEGHIEGRLVRKVKDLGGKAYKFSSPARRHVPDRLCVFPTGLIVFIECKAPGKIPQGAQANEIKYLNKKGCFATFVNTYEMVDNLIEQLREVIDDRSNSSK